MPFYEYRCQSCGHQVEVLQKMDDQPLDRCPHCDGLEMKKLISASAKVSSPAGGCGVGQSGEMPPCMTGGGCPSN